MKKIKMICLPFAGGSKYSYYRYVRLAPEWLEVIPVDLPGRGSRLSKPLLTDIHAIVDDILVQIRPHIDSPYILYGHSMGALTTLLLTRKMRDEGLPLPLHLFVTGHAGPSACTDRVVRHDLPEKELLTELNALDGMPAEIMEDEALLNFFLPVIRADFKAIETYRYQKAEKLDIAITCVIGTEENISLEDARAWQRETAAPVDVRQLPGKHFFIFQHDKAIIQLIGKMIAAHQRTLSQELAH